MKLLRMRCIPAMGGKYGREAGFGSIGGSGSLTIVKGADSLTTWGKKNFFGERGDCLPARGHRVRG